RVGLAAHQPPHLITLGQQVFGEVGPVLPGDPGDQRTSRHRQPLHLPLVTSPDATAPMARHTGYDAAAYCRWRGAIARDIPGRKVGCLEGWPSPDSGSDERCEAACSRWADRSASRWSPTAASRTAVARAYICATCRVS